jgi:hypothetical protein
MQIAFMPQLPRKANGPLVSVRENRAMRIREDVVQNTFSSKRLSGPLANNILSFLSQHQLLPLLLLNRSSRRGSIAHLEARGTAHFATIPSNASEWNKRQQLRGFELTERYCKQLHSIVITSLGANPIRTLQSLHGIVLGNLQTIRNFSMPPNNCHETMPVLALLAKVPKLVTFSFNAANFEPTKSIVRHLVRVAQNSSELVSLKLPEIDGSTIFTSSSGLVVFSFANNVLYN